MWKMWAFFGQKEKMNEHFRICEKNELKENKIKCSEYEFTSEEEEEMEECTAEEDANIKNNIFEKPVIEKCKNQVEVEEGNAKQQIELKNAEDIVKKILLKRQKVELDKQATLKRKKELKEQKRLKRFLKTEEDAKIKEDTKIQEGLERKKDSKAQKEEGEIFICYNDGKEFMTKRGYIKHFATLHPNEYPFYCHLCKYGSYSNKILENHYRSNKHIIKLFKLKNKK